MKQIKRLVTVALVGIGVCGVLWVAKGWTFKKADEKVAKFNSDCDNLILGIQQYKEFVGTYPIGNNQQIVKSLLGQTDKKVLILAVRRSDLNDKERRGEQREGPPFAVAPEAARPMGVCRLTAARRGWACCSSQHAPFLPKAKAGGILEVF